VSNPDASVRITFEPPPVTILIPSYNRVGYLQETIASCLAQDYPHCRVIVTDDGSTDGTVELVTGLETLGVGLVQGPHTGAPENRNRGLSAVSTPYVLWTGDDDVLVHDVVSRRIDRLSQVPDADVIHGDIAICDAMLTPQNIIAGEDWSTRPEALVSALFQRNVMADGGSLISMAVYARAGFYDPAFPKGQDYHLWSRAAASCKFVHDPGVGLLWRWHGTNMGLGSGTNPYADAHRRIVLEMWTRYDRRLLFPDIPWSTLSDAQFDIVGALAMAERLMREEAYPDALRFVQTALALGAGSEAEALAGTLESMLR
jgi:glycosyltransferase involved in cell wall biosynthesis